MSCSKQEETIHFASEADLPGKSIAVPIGSIYDIMLSERTDIQLERYNTISDIIAALKSGKVDAFLADEVSLSPSDRRRHQLKMAFRGTESFDVAFACKLSDGSIIQQFNAFLTEERQSGRYEQMRHRWFDTDEPDTVSMPHIEQATQGTPLRIIASMIQAPLTFREGTEWKGFEMELLQRFALYAGRPIVVDFYDMASAPAALQTDKGDIWCSTIFITEERKKSVLFTDPYYNCSSAYFVRDAEVAGTQSPWQLLKESVHKNLIVEDRWRFIADGLLETLIIAIMSLLLGTLLAWLLGKALDLIVKTKKV